MTEDHERIDEILAGYVLLGLAYFGSKLVLENLLGKHWG